MIFYISTRASSASTSLDLVFFSPFLVLTQIEVKALQRRQLLRLGEMEIESNSPKRGGVSVISF